MGRNRTRKRRQQHQPAIAPPVEAESGLFESRPFAAPVAESTQSAPSSFSANGHSLSRISPTATPTVQAKLTVGAAHDPYEQQADQTAATVVSRLNQPSFDPTPRRKRKHRSDPAPLSIQPLGTAAPAQAGPAPGKVERSIEAKRGQGRPLEDGTRSQMEGAFGHDFSGVNVHTDGESDQLNQSLSSRAFTTGQDIFFRQGEYAPSQRGGQELLAHELTHVVQQTPDSVNRKLPRPEGSAADLTANATTIARELAPSTHAVPTRPKRLTIQRELMSLQDFKRRTKVKRRKRGPGLTALDNAVKAYTAQPDVGKRVYLNRLMDQAEQYLVSKRNEGLSERSPRITGTLELLGNAYAELNAVNNNGSRQIDEADPNANQEQAPPRNYRAIDGQQYLITGQEPNRRIEEVRRYEDPVTGRPHYVAIGEVVDFENNMPVVNIYNEPRHLGDWYPRITQVNGMAVKPITGIRDAVSLQTEVNRTIREAQNGNELVLGQDTIDVLYTYSATLGKKDIIDCIKGKLRFTDAVTQLQTQVMMDAVLQRQRVVVSAHSRGTIKTDNAVRLAYKQLFRQNKDAFEQARQQEVIDLCIEHYQDLPEDIRAGLSLEESIDYFFPFGAAHLAEQTAKADMDQFIKLIYAGNAVTLPSSKLPVKMFVGKWDLAVSGIVGTYTDFWAKTGSGNARSSLTKVEGGHGFGGGYYRHAGQAAARDIIMAALEAV